MEYRIAITNFKVDPDIDVEGVHELILVDKFLGDVAKVDVELLRSV